MYEAAKDAVIAYEREDIKSAEQCLEKMDMCSKEVFTLMNEMKKLLN
ncbi:hypothetical protein HBE96_20715 [Clostridium sp. P21]|uniref:Uncharacterized protein n=1 Tax=Clostridium muellerianum TaxID=2716538 RepID=A0A7Y0EKE8_9CLOT|nr:hypothetical protein [Clostridium muellerianum]NMM65017.1 hypothetical protein [Clostridium muellerianum]